MRRIFFLSVLCSMLLLVGNAVAFEVGEHVEVCNDAGAYILLDAEAECTGEVLDVQVVEVREGEIDVKIGDQKIATVPLH